jgi:pimeloyl-ACP methyl ester carboxylesterase
METVPLRGINWRNARTCAGMTLIFSGSVAATGANHLRPPDVPASAYVHPQALVAIDGGRRLNLFCLGTGAPVVVMEAGGGDHSLSFQHVQARIAAATRVCSYDRAGLGFSDPPDVPGTASHIVRDLHSLIRAAHIPTPVVLVGHSSGGLYATLYAADYPEDIAGMVLIDPMTVGQDVVAERALDSEQLRKWLASDQRDIAAARRCLALARSGSLAHAPARYRTCLDDPPNASTTLHNVLNAQMARPSQQEAMLMETLDTYPPATGGLSNAEQVAQRAKFDFHNMPLVVVTATHEQAADGIPLKQGVKLLQALSDNDDLLAARSKRGVHVKVASVGEYIQVQNPTAIVQAVNGVVATVRRDLSLANAVK